MVDFECGAEVIAEGLSPQIMVVESVGTDSVVVRCAWQLRQTLIGVQCFSCHHGIAHNVTGGPPAPLFYPQA
jgi:hypothetical protein